MYYDVGVNDTNHNPSQQYPYLQNYEYNNFNPPSSNSQHNTRTGNQQQPQGNTDASAMNALQPDSSGSGVPAARYQEGLSSYQTHKATGQYPNQDHGGYYESQNSTASNVASMPGAPTQTPVNPVGSSQSALPTKSDDQYSSYSNGEKYQKYTPSVPAPNYHTYPNNSGNHASTSPPISGSASSVPTAQEYPSDVHVLKSSHTANIPGQEWTSWTQNHTQQPSSLRSQTPLDKSSISALNQSQTADTDTLSRQNAMTSLDHNMSDSQHNINPYVTQNTFDANSPSNSHSYNSNPISHSQSGAYTANYGYSPDATNVNHASNNPNFNHQSLASPTGVMNSSSIVNNKNPNINSDTFANTIHNNATSRNNAGNMESNIENTANKFDATGQSYAILPYSHKDEDEFRGANAANNGVRKAIGVAADEPSPQNRSTVAHGSQISPYQQVAPLNIPNPPSNKPEPLNNDLADVYRQEIASSNSYYSTSSQKFPSVMSSAMSEVNDIISGSKKPPIVSSNHQRQAQPVIPPPVNNATRPGSSAAVQATSSSRNNQTQTQFQSTQHQQPAQAQAQAQAQSHAHAPPSLNFSGRAPPPPSLPSPMSPAATSFGPQAKVNARIASPITPTVPSYPPNQHTLGNSGHSATGSSASSNSNMSARYMTSPNGSSGFNSPTSPYGPGKAAPSRPKPKLPYPETEHSLLGFPKGFGNKKDNNGGTFSSPESAPQMKSTVGPSKSSYSNPTADYNKMVNSGDNSNSTTYPTLVNGVPTANGSYAVTSAAAGSNKAIKNKIPYPPLPPKQPYGNANTARPSPNARNTTNNSLGSTSTGVPNRLKTPADQNKASLSMNPADGEGMKMGKTLMIPGSSQTNMNPGLSNSGGMVPLPALPSSSSSSLSSNPAPKSNNGAGRSGHINSNMDAVSFGGSPSHPPNKGISSTPYPSSSFSSSFPSSGPKSLPNSQNKSTMMGTYTSSTASAPPPVQYNPPPAQNHAPAGPMYSNSYVTNGYRQVPSPYGPQQAQQAQQAQQTQQQSYQPLGGSSNGMPAEKNYSQTPNPYSQPSKPTTSSTVSAPAPANGALGAQTSATSVPHSSSSTSPSRPHHNIPGAETKPPPRRTYTQEQPLTGAFDSLTLEEDSSTDPTKNGVSKSSKSSAAPLTIASFEALRQRVKVSKSNDPALQLELAKRLVEACSTLANKYQDPMTPARGNGVHDISKVSAAVSASLANSFDPSALTATRTNPYTTVDIKTERKNQAAWTMQAHKIVKKLAGTGYAPAMFYLASNYGSGGLGLEVDYEKAYELYYKSATKGDHAESAYRTAVCNEIGAGTKRDPQRAMLWYRKAAKLGDVSAMYKLGMIALNGLLDQRQSFQEGVMWLQRAVENADEDNPHAVHELGLLYERADQYPGNRSAIIVDAGGKQSTSRILDKDEKKAFELFLRAAKLGYPPSQFRLGCSYEYGTLGCPIDPKRSIAWYSRAAEKGEPESELALSGWYLTGSSGVLVQSDTEAYLWAKRAAEKGLSKAEYAVGYYTEVGIGVKPNLDEAKRWYFKAAAQRHPKALARLQEIRNGRR